MTTKPKILVVDDEPDAVELVEFNLKANGYDVVTATDGEEALEKARAIIPDLIVLDLMLPEVDGTEVCKILRRDQRTQAIPIIMLTAKAAEIDRVLGLELGADDYVTKPFSIDELMARIRAALRRTSSEKSAEETSILEAGDFLINLQTHQAFVRGEEKKLTPKEFDLLVYLMKNSEKVITHRTILAAVWGGNFTEQNEYLRVFLGNLRKKIEINPSKPQYILTEPWIGYRFNPAAQNS